MGRGVAPADWTIYNRQVRDEKVFMYHQQNPDATLADIAREFGVNTVVGIAARITRRYLHPPLVLPSRINDMDPFDYGDWQENQAA